MVLPASTPVPAPTASRRSRAAQLLVLLIYIYGGICMYVIDCCL